MALGCGQITMTSSPLYQDYNRKAMNGFEWEAVCSYLSGDSNCKPRKDLWKIDQDLENLITFSTTPGLGKMYCPAKGDPAFHRAKNYQDCNISKDYYTQDSTSGVPDDFCTTKIMDAFMNDGKFLSTTGDALTSSIAACSGENCPRDCTSTNAVKSEYPCFIFQNGVQADDAGFGWSAGAHDFNCAGTDQMMSTLPTTMSICEDVSAEEISCGSLAVNGEQADPLYQTHPVINGVISMIPSRHANFSTRCAQYGQINGLSCDFNYDQFTTELYHEESISYDCVDVELTCEELNIWNDELTGAMVNGKGFDYYSAEASRGCDKLVGCVGNNQAVPKCETFTNASQFTFKSILFNNKFKFALMTVEDRVVSLGELQTKCEEVNSFVDLSKFDFEQMTWKLDVTPESPICVDNITAEDTSKDACKIIAAIQQKEFVESACTDESCTADCVGASFEAEECQEEAGDITFPLPELKTSLWKMEYVYQAETGNDWGLTEDVKYRYNTNAYINKGGIAVTELNLGAQLCLKKCWNFDATQLQQSGNQVVCNARKGDGSGTQTPNGGPPGKKSGKSPVAIIVGSVLGVSLMAAGMVAYSMSPTSQILNRVEDIGDECFVEQDYQNQEIEF